MTHDLVWGVKLHRRNYARKTCLQNASRPGSTTWIPTDSPATSRASPRCSCRASTTSPDSSGRPAVRHGRAALVVAPADIDEVRAVVRVASAEGVRLLAQGANSGLVGASVPPADPPTVVLSTERLRSAPVIDIDGTTATVAAGTRLSELNEAAAIHGLHLPIDLGADPAIGGMIATNTGGSRVLRYGPMRRYVLAAEVVAADDDASVFGSLAALRKDSRGLDATQLGDRLRGHAGCDHRGGRRSRSAARVRRRRGGWPSRTPIAWSSCSPPSNAVVPGR